MSNLSPFRPHEYLLIGGPVNGQTFIAPNDEPRVEVLYPIDDDVMTTPSVENIYPSASEAKALYVRRSLRMTRRALYQVKTETIDVTIYCPEYLSSDEAAKLLHERIVEGA